MGDMNLDELQHQVSRTWDQCHAAFLRYRQLTERATGVKQDQRTSQDALRYKERALVERRRHIEIEELYVQLKRALAQAAVKAGETLEQMQARGVDGATASWALGLAADGKSA